MTNGPARWGVWVVLSALPGCAALERQTPGAALFGVGAALALAGAEVATGCPIDDDSFALPCDEQPRVDANPDVGVPMIAAGIGLAAIGGVMAEQEERAISPKNVRR